MDPLIIKGVALITGCGSGMGQAIAVKFAERGCQKLFLADLNLEGLQTTQTLVEAANKSTKVVLHVADISSNSSVESMIKTCVDEFGRIDFAMNNAGFAVGGTKTADLSTELFDKMCNVNEKGTFLCLKYEIIQMLKQEPLEIGEGTFDASRKVRGAIINTASLCASAVLKDFSAYTSSKHGVGMMTKQLAREYAPSKIRVNSICPGAVMTPMIAASGLSQDFLDGLVKQAPMNRFILTDEVAETVLFLAGSFGSAITGVNLPVDCGAALYHVDG